MVCVWLEGGDDEDEVLDFDADLTMLPPTRRPRRKRQNVFLNLDSTTKVGIFHIRTFPAFQSKTPNFQCKNLGISALPKKIRIFRPQFGT